ncbi:MAG: FeoB-associated Cys-rich membrane protein [Armatimonadetes bacterium]|nr:FeoB-associated Cys-rich membrane protein [Armatimonadota bacterium]
MDWQQIIVYLVVAGAALYLLRGCFGRRPKSGCGGCGMCGKAGCANPKCEAPGSLIHLGPRPTSRLPQALHAPGRTAKNRGERI